MRFILLCCLIILTYSTIFGQGQFQRLLDPGNASYKASAIGTNGHSYLSGTITQAPDHGVAIVEYDNNGDLVDGHFVSIGNGVYPILVSDMIVLSNGNLVILGQVADPFVDSLFVLALDPALSVAWLSGIGVLGQSVSATDIEETAGGDILVCGSYTTSPGRMIFLSRLSATGSEIWTKTYRTAGSVVSVFGTIRPLPSGEILLGGLGSQQPFETWIMLLNASGDEVWSRSYSNTYTFSVPLTKRFLPVANGYYLFQSGVPSSFEVQGKVIEIDNNGVEQNAWHVIIGNDSSGTLTDMVADPNGGFVLTGGREDLMNGRIWGVHLSDNLTVDWSMAYGPPGQAMGETALPLSGGGFLFGGGGENDSLISPFFNPLQGYSVMTDPNGNTGYCDESLAVNVVTVPVSSSPTNQNIGQLPNGASWVAGIAQIQSTLSELPHCTSIIASQAEHNARSFDVYPNPTNGKVFIDMPSGQWSHRLYDSRTTLLNTWRTAAERMDLTLDHGPGLYLLVSTNGDEQVITRILFK